MYVKLVFRVDTKIYLRVQMMRLYEKYEYVVCCVCVLYCSLGAGTVPRHHICKGGTIESVTANIYSTQRLSLRHIKCTKV